MPTYLLRDVDDEMWTRAKARATQDGYTLRGVIVALMEAYAAGPFRFVDPEPPPATSRTQGAPGGR